VLDDKLIKVLAFVVQEGGFDKAAKRLHISQSAVSLRVKCWNSKKLQISSFACITSFGYLEKSGDFQDESSL